MARRTPKATDNTATEEVTTDATEATEAPSKKSNNKKEKVVSDTTTTEVEFDLTEFNTAVQAALESSDPTSGIVSPEGVEQVNVVYRSIDGLKNKNAARNALESEMKAALEGKGEYEAMSQMDRFLRARGYVSIREGLAAASKSGGSSKAPADPTDAFVQQAVSLRLAYSEVVSNVPEGVAEDWSTRADELAASLSGDMDKLRNAEGDEKPEVHPVARQAFKLSRGKGFRGGARRTYEGARRDVLTHVKQVFENLQPGSTLTVTEVAKAESAEYGSDRPSPGAVSARFFKDGEPVEVDGLVGYIPEEGARGIRKL